MSGFFLNKSTTPLLIADGKSSAWIPAKEQSEGHPNISHHSCLARSKPLQTGSPSPHHPVHSFSIGRLRLGPAAQRRRFTSALLRSEPSSRLLRPLSRVHRTSVPALDHHHRQMLRARPLEPRWFARERLVCLSGSE